MNVAKPCTLICSKEMSGPVSMKDERGRLWYFRPNIKAGHFKINVPNVGQYFIKGAKVEKVLPLQKTVHNIVLPPYERQGNPPVKAVYQKRDIGKTPAKIYAKHGVVFVGDRFNLLPPPVRLFILMHEAGHRYYSTEHFCDLYALKCFLDAGYNGSTALFALSRVLETNGQNKQRNAANIERIKQLFQNIPKTKQ